ncbi:hypothetical protein [Candidatus Palauibacter sp.]|uniref:hypothetical protein n=1 Tax=Candidatus Palauibacter sp. TaxID=3101350 RepID=UPI003B01E735
MAETWWSIRWRNGDELLAAIGVRNDRMPVYREEGNRLYRLRATFPSCLKFMPYAEVVEDWRRVSRKKIQARIVD